MGLRVRRAEQSWVGCARGHPLFSVDLRILKMSTTSMSHFYNLKNHKKQNEIILSTTLSPSLCWPWACLCSDPSLALPLPLPLSLPCSVFWGASLSGSAAPSWSWPVRGTSRRVFLPHLCLWRKLWQLLPNTINKKETHTSRPTIAKSPEHQRLREKILKASEMEEETQTICKGRGIKTHQVSQLFP